MKFEIRKFEVDPVRDTTKDTKRLCDHQVI
jgi:hypothetical protein